MHLITECRYILHLTALKRSRLIFCTFPFNVFDMHTCMYSGACFATVGPFSPDSGDWKSAVSVEPRFIGFEFIALSVRPWLLFYWISHSKTLRHLHTEELGKQGSGVLSISTGCSLGPELPLSSFLFFSFPCYSIFIVAK